MLKRLIAFLLGHLRIEVTGGRIERFLNLALEAGIYLWQIERRPDSIRASITVRDFFVLRSVARGARSRVRILQRHGFPFAVARVRRRPMLLAGIVACLGFVFWASSHVWVISVKITGPQNLDPRAVKAIAAEAGLAPGVYKGRLDLEKVRAHLQTRMEEISWAVIRMQGTRVEIEVVERAASRIPNQAACVNLVARKAGVIEQVVPFQGEPRVKKGDIVQPGDLLVECSLRYWSGGRPSVYPGMPLPERESVARTLVARAQVKARINYQQYKEIPLYQEVSEPTGETVTRWVLNWNGKPIILRGQASAPFDRYEEHRKTYSLGSWRNRPPTVELVQVTVNEIRVRRERIPLSTALDQATEQVAKWLRWILGPSDKILTAPAAKVVEQGTDFIGVQVMVETLEDITQPVEGVGVPMPPGRTGE